MKSPNGSKHRKSFLLVLTAMVGMGAASLATARGGSKEEVTLANLEERLEGARSARDHRAIASFYQRQGEEAQQNARKHEVMARAYKRKTTKVVRSSGAMVEHCNQLASSYRSLSQALFVLAKDHEAKASGID